MTPPRPLTLGILAALVLLALAPAGASAGAVKVTTMEDREGTFGTFDYTAAPGERNRLRIVVTKKGARIEDSAGVRAGRRCTRVSRTVATCRRNPDWFDTDVDVSLGNRSDRARLSAIGGSLTGGPGNDVLRASASKVRFGAVTALFGGTGNDRMTGGPGSDEFYEGKRRNGHDTMIGKGGFDSVHYSERRGNVRADLSGDRDDGARGERDLIASDVESIDSGAGADRLTGNDAANFLAGGPAGTASVGSAAMTV